MSQDTLPYYSIGEYPETYNVTATVTRMIDGLGYRYHWATKDLTQQDLAYLPGNEGMSCRKVLEHLGGLSYMIYNVATDTIHTRKSDFKDMEWSELRAFTLNHLAEASAALTDYDGDLADLPIRFGAKKSVPFWHLINGPISDAIYHVGQIVSYRRSTNNPMDPGVSVFSGKTRKD